MIDKDLKDLLLAVLPVLAALAGAVVSQLGSFLDSSRKNNFEREKADKEWRRQRALKRIEVRREKLHELWDHLEISKQILSDLWMAARDSAEPFPQSKDMASAATAKVHGYSIQYFPAIRKKTLEVHRLTVMLEAALLLPGSFEQNVKGDPKLEMDKLQEELLTARTQLWDFVESLSVKLDTEEREIP